MTLEQYDRAVGHHLRMIRHHAASIVAHVSYMTHQPDFETVAEEKLIEVEDVLANAATEVRTAILKFRSKPRDA